MLSYLSSNDWSYRSLSGKLDFNEFEDCTTISLTSLLDSWGFWSLISPLQVWKLWIQTWFDVLHLLLDFLYPLEVWFLQSYLFKFWILKTENHFLLFDSSIGFWPHLMDFESCLSIPCFSILLLVSRELEFSWLVF